MEFAYIITLAAFLVCFLAALVGLRLAASELSSPVPGSSWRCDAFLPVLLVSFAAFVLLFAFANRTYDQIFPLTWVDLLLAFVSAAAVYAVSLFKKTGRFALPALAGAVLLCVSAGRFHAVSESSAFLGRSVLHRPALDAVCLVFSLYERH